MDSLRTCVRRRARWSALLAMFALIAPITLGQVAADDGTWVGLTVSDALERLRSSGLVIVHTDRIVGESMVVVSEPNAADPREILLEILAAHGLVADERSPGVFVVTKKDERLTLTGLVRAAGSGDPIPGAEIRIRGTDRSTHTALDGSFELDTMRLGGHSLEVRAFGFVTLTVDVEIAAEQSNVVVIDLPLSAALHEELVVQPSQLRLLETEPSAPLSFTREQIDRLPHLGGDFLRAVSLLPGTSANDITAQFNVHGGRRDEVQIVLDGQELYDAFHLKDYDNALSIIADENLSLARLSTGAFPASYGDRMSGVLDLTTVAPTLPLATRLSASVTSLSVLNSGRLRSRRGGWLLSGRTSSPVIPSDVIGNAKPSFWDVFAKVEYDLSARQTMTARLLGAGDRLTEIEQVDDLFKNFDTEYNSFYGWVIHQAIAGGRSLVRTTASWSSIDRDRRGFENDDEFTFEVRDLRGLEVRNLSQTWDVQLAPDHVLRFGADVRQFDASYDYVSLIEELDGEQGSTSSDDYVFADEFDGDHYGVWVSDRFSLVEPLTVELGLRFDKHSLTDDSLTSPRVNAAWRLAEGSVLRASWGLFHQTQRPYELQIEDRETHFFEPERSEHWVLGYERLFGEGSRIRALRVEAYSRRISNPRQRFENLIEPINTFPEIEPDRVRVVSDEGRADGVELLVRGTAGARVDWGFMYAWSRSEDHIDGQWRSKPTDQRHTITADCSYRLTDRWNLNVAWRFHTGWPTTAVFVRTDEDGEADIAFGPYNAERLPTYHRLDLRLTRDWQVRRGRITFYLDVQNIYNQENVAGFDAVIDDDTGELAIETEHWPGILPSLGISWQF